MATSANPITSYISFWNRYTDICKSSNLQVSPARMPFQSRIIGKKYLISLNEPIYLQGWPENSASIKKKIDILVDGFELIESGSVIVRSNVAVNYFDTGQKLSKNVLKPLQSIHYDYSEPQVGHPHFHAQLSEGLIKEKDKSEAFKRYRLDPPNLDDRLKGMRIPTSHVSLISVLVGLIADHSRRVPALDAEKKAVHKADVLEKIIQEIGQIEGAPVSL
jgi:hypothetical protein